MTFVVAADAYDRYMGRYSAPLAREMAARARIRPGLRALDVGCGPGALTAALAEVVGAQNVGAVDPSEPFVVACRARVPGADVRLASAEELPFASDSFDAVLSQLVVTFVPDAPAGVREMRRVAKRGGLVASCVWDYAGEMELLRTFWDAALALDENAPDEARTRPYCTAAELAGLWAEAGLRDVATDELVVEAAYEDFDDFWTPFLGGVGPAGAYAVSRDPAAQAALREEVRRRLGDRTGPFRLRARAWYVEGRA